MPNQEQLKRFKPEELLYELRVRAALSRDDRKPIVATRFAQDVASINSSSWIGGHDVIAFDCTGCSQNFTVKDEFAGKSTKCPKCGTSLRVPAHIELLDPKNPPLNPY